MKSTLSKYCRAFIFIVRNRRDFEPKIVSAEALKFAPAKLQLEAGGSSGYVKWTAAAILVILAAGTLWSAFAETEIIIAADGKCIPAKPAIPIVAPEAGRVTDVLVTDGADVKTGQLLFRMESDSVDIDVARILRALEVEGAHIDMIKHARSCVISEAVGSDMNCPNALHSNVKDVERFYRDKTFEYHSKLHQRIEEMAQITSFLEHENARLDQLNRLLKTSDSTTAQIFEVEQIRKERQRLLTMLAGENRISKESYLKELSDLATQHGRAIESLHADLKKAHALRNKLDLHAVEDGVMNELTITTPGQSVVSSQLLARIIPSGKATHVEVYVPSKEMARVKVGQSAKIKFESIDFTRNGSIAAIVDYIASDASSDDRKGTIMLARVKMEEASINRISRNFNIRPGMTAKVEFIVGQRSVLDYVLSPVRRVTSEALHEQ